MREQRDERAITGIALRLKLRTLVFSLHAIYCMMDAHYHYSYPVCILFRHCKYCFNILIWEEIACISVVYFIAVMFYVIAFTIHVLCSIYVSINSDFPCLKIGKKKKCCRRTSTALFQIEPTSWGSPLQALLRPPFLYFYQANILCILSYVFAQLLSYTRIRSYSFTHYFFY